MTNKKKKEKLDSAETSSEKRGIIESMRNDIVNAAKAQMRFAEQWINNDATLTDEKKQEFKRLLNIESIKLDVQF